MGKGKIKNFFKKSWNYINNKKTIIGGIIYAAAYGTKVFAPDLMPEPIFDLIENVGIGIMGVGGVHKFGKIVIHKADTKDATWKESFKAGFVKPKINK